MTDACRLCGRPLIHRNVQRRGVCARADCVKQLPCPVRDEDAHYRLMALTRDSKRRYIVGRGSLAYLLRRTYRYRTKTRLAIVGRCWIEFSLEPAHQ
jgi:hypothetical protein